MSKKLSRRARMYLKWGGVSIAVWRKERRRLLARKGHGSPDERYTSVLYLGMMERDYPTSVMDGCRRAGVTEVGPGYGSTQSFRAHKARLFKTGVCTRFNHSWLRASWGDVTAFIQSGRRRGLGQ